MTLNDLYDRAATQGVEIDDVPLRKLVSASFPEGWIAIDTGKLPTEAEEKVVLAHELGHIETGSFYNIHSPYDLRAKHEHCADRRAIQMLIPRDQLKSAVRSGCREVWELSEHFGVTEDFVRKAVAYYTVHH